MRVTASQRAVAVVERVTAARRGQLTFTIGTGCCESTAPFLYEDFWPGPDQEPVGEVAGVTVFAPEYLRAMYPDGDGLVIDVVEDEPADSLSIETEFGCRFLLRGQDGVSLGSECVLPADRATVASVATGGPSRVVGDLPEPLRRLRIR